MRQRKLRVLEVGVILTGLRAGGSLAEAEQSTGWTGGGDTCC
jgi:hypothetical protein